MLTELAGSRTAPIRAVERARVLLSDAQGLSISAIQRTLGVSRPTLYTCIDKALAGGIRMGLKDYCHRPRAPAITAEAKAWVVSVACVPPKAVGLAAALWSLSALARQVSAHAEEAGFPRLAGCGKSTLWRILQANPLKPHKITDYLAKRDSAFDRKM